MKIGTCEVIVQYSNGNDGSDRKSAASRHTIREWYNPDEPDVAYLCVVPGKEYGFFVSHEQDVAVVETKVSGVDTSCSAQSRPNCFYYYFKVAGEAYTYKFASLPVASGHLNGEHGIPANRVATLEVMVHEAEYVGGGGTVYSGVASARDIIAPQAKGKSLAIGTTAGNRVSVQASITSDHRAGKLLSKFVFKVNSCDYFVANKLPECWYNWWRAESQLYSLPEGALINPSFTCGLEREILKEGHQLIQSNRKADEHQALHALLKKIGFKIGLEGDVLTALVRQMFRVQKESEIQRYIKYITNKVNSRSSRKNTGVGLSPHVLLQSFADEFGIPIHIYQYSEGAPKKYLVLEVAPEEKHKLWPYGYNIGLVGDPTTNKWVSITYDDKPIALDDDDEATRAAQQARAQALADIEAQIKELQKRHSEMLTDDAPKKKVKKER